MVKIIKITIMDILVITEIDLSDNENTTIGVADSPEHAESMIKEHYGKDSYEEINRWDTKHLNGEFALKLKIYAFDNIDIDEYNVIIRTEWFKLNKLNKIK